MRAKQQISLVADSSANVAAEGFASGQRLQIGHPAIMHGVGAGRIEFDGGKAFFNAARSNFGAGVGIVIEVGRIRIVRRIEIGIGAQTLIHLAAQKRMYRPVKRLADNVPASHFQAAENTLNRGIRPVRKARSMHLTPELLYPVGCFTLQIAGEHILCHMADHLWCKTGGIDFANPADAAGRMQAHKDKIPPAKARWRRSDDKGFECFKAHWHGPEYLVAGPGFCSRDLVTCLKLLSLSGVWRAQM